MLLQVDTLNVVEQIASATVPDVWINYLSSLTN